MSRIVGARCDEVADANTLSGSGRRTLRNRTAIMCDGLMWKDLNGYASSAQNISDLGAPTHILALGIMRNLERLCSTLVVQEKTYPEARHQHGDFPLSGAIVVAGSFCRRWRARPGVTHQLLYYNDGYCAHA
jgi:hypothetical protein